MKYIKKAQRYNGLLGKIFNTLNINTDKDTASINAIKKYVEDKIKNRNANYISVASLSELEDIINSNLEKSLNIENTAAFILGKHEIPPWSKWHIPVATKGDYVGYIIYPDANTMYILGHSYGNFFCRQIAGITTQWTNLNPTGTAKYRIVDGNTVEINIFQLMRIGTPGWVLQFELPPAIIPKMIILTPLVTNASDPTVRTCQIVTSGEFLVYSNTSDNIDPLLGFITYKI